MLDHARSGSFATLARDPTRLIARKQFRCGLSAEKDKRSNKCHKKELEVLLARRKQPPSRRRRLRL
jgi:hypothetical protein